VEFGPNDHQEDTPHFNKTSTHSKIGI